MSKEDFTERLKNTGRNDQCPCGTGKKYKKCHLAQDELAQQKTLQEKLEAQKVDVDDQDSTELQQRSASHFNEDSRQKMKLKKTVSRSNAPRRPAGTS